MAPALAFGPPYVTANRCLVVQWQSFALLVNVAVLQSTGHVCTLSTLVFSATSSLVAQRSTGIPPCQLGVDIRKWMHVNYHELKSVQRRD